MDDRAEGIRGVYGLRISGVPGAAALLSPIGSGAPTLHIDRRIGRAAISGTGVADDRAQFELEEAGLLGLEIWRNPLRACFTGSAPPDDQALIHPFLVLAAATAARWLGWEALHAGGFRLGDAAWGVLGDRNAGKSSTLCDLALRGVDVLSDDLLVLDGGDALAGPNSVDLRPGSARHLGVGEYLGVVGARERWRVVTPPSSPRARLAGFVSLSWGDRLELVAVPPSRRIGMLLAGQTLALPSPEPGRLLRMAALPFWELRRPKEWSALAAAGELLVTRLS